MYIITLNAINNFNSVIIVNKSFFQMLMYLYIISNIKVPHYNLLLNMIVVVDMVAREIISYQNIIYLIIIFDNIKTTDSFKFP